MLIFLLVLLCTGGTLGYCLNTAFGMLIYAGTSRLPPFFCLASTRLLYLYNKTVHIAFNLHPPLPTTIQLVSIIHATGTDSAVSLAVLMPLYTSLLWRSPPMSATQLAVGLRVVCVYVKYVALQKSDGEEILNTMMFLFETCPSLEASSARLCLAANQHPRWRRRRTAIIYSACPIWTPYASASCPPSSLSHLPPSSLSTRLTTSFALSLHPRAHLSDIMAQPASASQLPPGVTDPNYKPLPGRLGNLTVPQQHALSKLKKELEAEGHFLPERHDDALLLRSVVSWTFLTCARDRADEHCAVSFVHGDLTLRRQKPC